MGSFFSSVDQYARNLVSSIFSTAIFNTSSEQLRITRDMTAASGDVSYTGVGFAPKCLIVFAFIDGSSLTSHGTSSGLSNYGSYKTGDGTVQNTVNRLIQAMLDGANYQYATIKSLDADGFTLSWVKGGAPTGTLIVDIIAIK